MRKILLWCASLAVLGLAACDSSTSSDSSSTPSELVGIWKDSIPSYGTVIYLQLKSGGSGLVKAYTLYDNALVGTDSAVGTWTASGGKLVVNAVYDGATIKDTAAYTVSGSSLTLKGSVLGTTGSYTFTKATAIVAPKF